MRKLPEKVLSGNEYQDKLEENIELLDRIDSFVKSDLVFKKILYQPVAELVSKDVPQNSVHDVSLVVDLKRCIKKFCHILKRIAISLSGKWDIGKSQYLFTFFDSHRKDKIALFHSIFDHFQKESFLVDYKLIGQLKKTFILDRTLKKLSYATRFLLSMKFNFDQHHLWCKLVVLEELLELYDFSEVIASQDLSSLKGVLAFTDYAPFDNLIIQHIKQNYEVTSFTFQHAIYHINPRNMALLGNITHENFISDYMLCWGKDTIARLVKIAGIDKKRLIEICHPARHCYRPTLDMNRELNVKMIIILMSQKRMELSNFAMLKTAQELCKNLNLSYQIKLHPSLSAEKYLALVDGDEHFSDLFKNDKLVVDLITEDAVFVCHTTTAYYEVLACGLPCFRYYDYALRPFLGLNDKFETAQELEILIAKLPKNRKQWYCEDVEPLINEVFGESVAPPHVEYKKVIESIINGSTR